jgi:hypothetical protein
MITAGGKRSIYCGELFKKIKILPLNSKYYARMGSKEGGFTILEEDPATYPHTCFSPVTYMGTVITKWATQCLPWVNTRDTIETIKEVINLLDKLSRSQVFAADPS